MKPLFRLACVFLLLISLAGEVWARGSRSSGSFSGGSRSSSSGSRSYSSGSSGSSSRSSGSSSWGGGSSSSTRSSSGSGSSWGSGSRFSGSGDSSSSRSTNRSDPSSSDSTSGWGTSTSSSTRRSNPSSSATDSALARKVGQGGTTFSSRSDAVRDFEQKHAAEYATKFPTQPSTRPNYIPPTTTINGQNYPVQYDANYGGYGAWVGNRWSAYDVMRDSIMLNALMNQRNYSYGGDYGYTSRPEHYRNSSGSSDNEGGGGWLILIILVIVGYVIYKYLKSRAAVQKNPFSAEGTTTGTTGAAVPPARDLSTSTMDKSQPADWLAVKPNSIVTVSDEQGIADSMKRGLGVKGIDYTVKAVAVMKQLENLSTHLLFTLHDEEQVAYLLVKIVDENIDLGLYIEVEGLAQGSRKEIVDRGDLWLFQAPANPSHFQVADLKYTTTLKQTLPGANGQQEEVTYEMKGQGELQCDYEEKPARTGMGSGEGLATVVEYRTDQPAENPEFLVLETGTRRSQTSYLQFFIGCPIKFSEVDVLPV